MSDDQEKKIISIVPDDSSDAINRLLWDFIKRAPHMKAIAIIGINKDETQFLETTSMSLQEKCLLKCFFDSYLNEHFQLYHIHPEDPKDGA